MILVGCESDEYINCMHSALEHIDVNIKVTGVTYDDLETMGHLLGCEVKLVKHVSRKDIVDMYKKEAMFR